MLPGLIILPLQRLVSSLHELIGVLCHGSSPFSESDSFFALQNQRQRSEVRPGLQRKGSAPLDREILQRRAVLLHPCREALLRISLTRSVWRPAGVERERLEKISVLDEKLHALFRDVSLRSQLVGAYDLLDLAFRGESALAKNTRQVLEVHEILVGVSGDNLQELAQMLQAGQIVRRH